MVFPPAISLHCYVCEGPEDCAGPNQRHPVRTHPNATVRFSQRRVDCAWKTSPHVSLRYCHTDYHDGTVIRRGCPPPDPTNLLYYDGYCHVGSNGKKFCICDQDLCNSPEWDPDDRFFVLVLDDKDSSSGSHQRNNHLTMCTIFIVFVKVLYIFLHI